VLCNKAKQCNVCDGWFKMERGCTLEKRCPSCRELGLSKSIRTRKDDYPCIFSATLHSLVTPSKYSLILTSPHNDVLREYFIFEYIPQHCDNASNMDEEFMETIEEVLSHLNKRERMVISMRFGLNEGEGDTLEYIASALSITKERVRQIESSGIKKLKHPKVSRLLKQYIEGK